MKCEIGKSMASGMTQEQAFDDLRKREQECFERSGWYAHLVVGDPNFPYKVNYHTHGLTESLNHPDFQLVVPLSENTVQYVFVNLIDRIKTGEIFKDGDVVENIVSNYKVKLVSVTEGNRTVLRIILPDKHGNLDKETLKELTLQYQEL